MNILSFYCNLLPANQVNLLALKPLLTKCDRRKGVWGGDYFRSARACTINAPSSVGFRATFAPAAVSASILA